MEANENSGNHKRKAPKDGKKDINWYQKKSVEVKRKKSGSNLGGFEKTEG